MKMIPSPKVFVSHSSKDKPFARRLGNELRGFGAKIWIDEVEIKIGDSLIEKISEGIDDGDYLLVILSNASIQSPWVRKEVNIAITRGIEGKSIKVLPCLVETCTIPTFLADIKYADFRDKNGYRASRDQVVNAIGLKSPTKQEEFYQRFLAYDLVDLNDGFDSPSIHYYSSSDFEKLLKRYEIYDGSVFGIEPWPDKAFYDVKVHEEYSKEASDSSWYFQAFDEFKEEGVSGYYSLSGQCPDSIIDRFL